MNDERKSDALLAKRAREEMTIKLLEVGEIMDRYKLDGLIVNFQMQNHHSGKTIIASIDVVRPL